MSETVPAKINSTLGGSSRVGNIITLSAFVALLDFESLTFPVLTSMPTAGQRLESLNASPNNCT